MSLFEIIHSLLGLFIPDHCISSLFEDKWMSGACFKAFITKGLGYAIILGSVLVKVPQILKLLNAGNARGLSVLGVLLELIASTGTMCYSMSMQFPFSSYGESVFMLLQLSIIFFLLIFFNHNLISAVISYTIFVGILSILLSPLTPHYLLFFLQASVIFLLVASRLSQSYSNYSNGSTGQLSLISVLLQWAGSAARIFTSLSEIGDMTTVLMFIASFATNSLLLLQLWYYWSSEVNGSENNRDSKRGAHFKGIVGDSTKNVKAKKLKKVN